MCIHHMIFYEACGHSAKHTKLSTQTHCNNVDLALRYYHDQRGYRSTSMLLQKYITDSAECSLPVPQACPPVWPPLEGGLNYDKQIVAEYNQWMKDVGNLHYEHYKRSGSSKAFDYHTKLNANSIKDSAMSTLASSKNSRFHNIRPHHQAAREIAEQTEYDKVEHCINLISAQVQHPELHPRWNVVIHHTDGGCGRRPEPNCQRGHNSPNEPQCPYLIAHRLQNPQSKRLPREISLLKDLSASSWGGIADLAPKSLDNRDDNIRSALVYTSKSTASSQMRALEPQAWQTIFEPSIGPFRIPKEGTNDKNGEKALPHTRHVLNPAIRSLISIMLARLGLPSEDIPAETPQVEHGIRLDGGVDITNMRGGYYYPPPGKTSSLPFPGSISLLPLPTPAEDAPVPVSGPAPPLYGQSYLSAPPYGISSLGVPPPQGYGPQLWEGQQQPMVPVLSTAPVQPEGRPVYVSKALQEEWGLQ